MVGLVVVSHSRALAAGVAELAGGVGETPIPLAYAGGAGQDHGALGTDATDIMEAISAVDSDAGVLVLMDLGSAILSAETAVDLLEGALTGPVRLTAAPLVEGAVSAAVQIALGSDLETVAAEARGALAPKRRRLGEPDAASPTDAGEEAGEEAGEGSWLTACFQVDTLHGLHARPAAALVRTIGGFAADARVRREGDDRWVNARSLNRIATLQVGHGDRFELRAAGGDRAALLDAVRELVAANFGEDTVTAPSETDQRPPVSVAVSSRRGVLVGEAASPGVATAPLFVIEAATVVFEDRELRKRAEPLATAAVDALVQPFLDARRRVIDALRTEGGAPTGAEIAAAHAVLLADPEIESELRNLLAAHDCGVARAFREVMSKLADSYRAVDDHYLKARATDVEDTARRVLAILAPERVRGGIDRSTGPAEASILLTEDLLPSQSMHLNPETVVGIVTTGGSASSHAAIIARGLGIPMVVGVRLPRGRQTDLHGTAAVIDGATGEVEVEPSERRIAAVRAAMREAERVASAQRVAAARPGALGDGTPFSVDANVATAMDACRAAGSGADGVGLLRTEFMFLGATRLPDEERQVELLRAMVAPFAPRPITARLVDIGGDKALPGVSLPREANPFLGLRGVRLLIDPRYRQFAAAHARALLRIAADCTLKLMIPMVGTVGEIEAVRELLAEARRSLAERGTRHGAQVPLGIMVETPAAALRAADLAPHSAFFSIGTNDLTQYVMAAERGNAELGSLFDGLHPAVLQAIDCTVSAARAHAVPVGVCGELVSDAAALPLLVGLGVERVSVNAAALPVVKRRLASLELHRCREAAEAALRCSDAAGVRALCKANFDFPA